MGYFFRILLLGAAFLYAGFPVRAAIVINEFLANPSGPSSEETEWIELYNTDAQPVDLAGWKLDDEEGGSGSFTIASASSIVAGGFLVFEKSQTGIALNNTGDTVRLINPAGEVADSYAYQATTEDVSMGRSSDGGGSWTTCTALTRGALNNCPLPTQTPTQTATPTHSPAPTVPVTSIKIPTSTKIPTPTKGTTPSPTRIDRKEASESADVDIPGVVLGNVTEVIQEPPVLESSGSAKGLRAFSAAFAMVAAGLALLSGVLVWQRRNAMKPPDDQHP